MTTARDLIVDQSAAMVESGARLTTWYAQGHADGLGDRLLMFDNTSAPSWEILRFKPALARDATVRDRAASANGAIELVRAPSLSDRPLDQGTWSRRGSRGRLDLCHRRSAVGRVEKAPQRGVRAATGPAADAGTVRASRAWAGHRPRSRDARSRRADVRRPADDSRAHARFGARESRAAGRSAVGRLRNSFTPSRAPFPATRRQN